MSAEAQDGFRAWFSTLWPVVVVVIGASLVFGQQANTLANINDRLSSLEEAMNSRFEAVDSYGQQREKRLYDLESDAKLFQERMTGMSSAFQAIQSRLQVDREQQKREHDEIKTLLQDRHEPVPGRR